MTDIKFVTSDLLVDVLVFASDSISTMFILRLILQFSGYL